VLVYFYLHLVKNNKEYNNKEKKMTHLLRLAFVLGISMLVSPVVNADMGPDCAPQKRVVQHKKNVHCPTRHHMRCHKPACAIDCCEITVNNKDIKNSEILRDSGSLHADTLYYEYVRAQALNLAVKKRMQAAELCKRCPAEAQELICEARHLEFNWRRIEGCDFSPINPCEVKHHHHHHGHHHHHAQHSHCG
jgi:hypothetical protein